MAFSRPMASERKPESGRVRPFAKLSIETVNVSSGTCGAQHDQHLFLEAEIARNGSKLGRDHHSS